MGLSYLINEITDENRTLVLLLIARNYDEIGCILSFFPIPHPDIESYERKQIERVTAEEFLNRPNDEQRQENHFDYVHLNEEQFNIFNRLLSRIDTFR